MTTYIITATVESFKVYWSGVEWAPSKSQARKFSRREDANIHRDANPEVLKELPIKFIRVEHGE